MSHQSEKTADTAAAKVSNVQFNNKWLAPGEYANTTRSLPAQDTYTVCATCAQKCTQTRIPQGKRIMGQNLMPMHNWSIVKGPMLTAIDDRLLATSTQLVPLQADIRIDKSTSSCQTSHHTA